MKNIYQIFLKGLLTLLPISITVSVIVWVTSAIEDAIGEPLRDVLPEAFYFPGVGLLLGIALVFVVGLLVNNYMTAQLVEWIETSLERVPLIKTIYNPLRDVMNLFGSQDDKSLKRVVLVELPSLGMSLLGLVTRDSFSELPNGTVPQESLAVFIPYSYAMGGFTVIVPKQQVREVDIPVEKAMQLAITAWIKFEKNIKEGPSPSSGLPDSLSGKASGQS